MLWSCGEVDGMFLKISDDADGFCAGEVVASAVLLIRVCSDTEEWRMTTQRMW